MTLVMSFLGVLVSIYMIILFFRIILTWFSWTGNSGIMNFLAAITDPYLNWFRRFSFLRAGAIDFSPLVAIGVLSLVNRIFTLLGRYGTISFGIILVLMLQVAWSAVSFIIWFLIVILVLRFIAHLAVRNSVNPFWRIIEGISQPVLFRVNRLLFKNRIVNFGTGILISVAALVILYCVLKILVMFLTRMLAGLPF